MRLSTIVLALVLAPTLALAQAETTGRVSGRAVDEGGAPVPGAKVSITSPAMQGERTFTTDANGRFLAPLLPPGEYVVVFTAPGRQTVGFTARVGVGQTVPLEAMLAKGELVEEVKVTGDMSKLETTAGGENFNYETKVDSLPIVDRDPERVAELAPNIAFGPSADTLSISGAPSFDTVVLLDGAEVSDPYYGSAPQLFLEDALEEVQVLTSGVPARYGRFQGGVINATTKSGGNTLDATLRADLNRESWNETTPFPGEQQADTLNRTYQATVGGPILKDRLWYFVGGRTIPAEQDSQLTQVSGESFVETSEQDRFQIKLTGAITPNHVIEASHLNYDQTTTNYAGLPAADLLALGQRADPRKTYTLEYQGILSDRLFLNLQGTSKRVSIKSGGDPAKGDPFLDYYIAGDIQVWHNAWWDYNDTDVRDNDTLSASLTQMLSGGKWGDHTLEYGIQHVVNTTGGENRQSSTGYNLLVYQAPLDPRFPFSNVDDPDYDPADPRFNLLSLFGDPYSGVSYRWEALPLGGDQTLENTAIYVQDTWQKGNWRVDAGLRWEQYQGDGPEETLNLDFQEVSPRLGVTYNMDNDWQLQATWGKYVSRFNDNVASNISGVGGAPYIQTLYTGPNTCPIVGTGDPGDPVRAQHCLTYDQVQEILRDDANWELITAITDPNQPTRYLDPDAHAPYADELNLAVKRALPRNTGSLTLTYTTRRYKDLLDDYVGGLGTSIVEDPKGSGAEFEFDTTVWQNSFEAKREYESLTAAWDYRPNVKWGIGGNWTYSWTRGNYEGEGENQPSSGSIIGNYPNSIPYEAAVPYGYLGADIRHRVRAWGNYRFDLKRAGSLSLGAIGTYQSGSPWSKVVALPLTDDPEYLNDTGTYAHYFDGRGNNRFSGWWRLDLSTRYQLAMWKDLNFWAKLDILNLTNNDQLIAFNTEGQLDEDVSLPVWIPTENFGKARNETDYQLPRSYFVALGLQW